MAVVVRVGHRGDIKKFLKCASKRESHVDMEFICGAAREVLKCHRFIIGAQSSFLKSLMLSAETDAGICQIFLPEVQKKHMDVVLQFLYTGKLKLQADIVNQVRELVVDILRIDADFKLPCDETLLGGGKENGKKDGDNPGGGPASPPSSSDKDYPSTSDMSKTPPKKRFKPNNCNDGHSRNSVEDSSMAAMSAPHVQVDDQDGDEIQILPSPPKKMPPVIEIDDEEASERIQEELVKQKSLAHSLIPCVEASEALDGDEDEDTPLIEAADLKPSIIVRNDDEEYQFRHLELPPAPRVIAKKTAPHPTYFAKKSAPPIIRAPKVVAKSTGAFFKKNVGRPRKSVCPATESNLIPESLENPPQNQISFTITPLLGQEQLILPAESGQPFVINFHEEERATRTKTGAIKRSNFAEFSDDDHDEVANSSDKDFVPSIDSPLSQVSEETLSVQLELPPPIPEPPEPGLVLYRGEWMTKAKMERLKEGTKNRKSTNRGIRGYHPNMYTITGKTLSFVSQYRKEEDGRHECSLCPAVFARTRSLIVHYSREHNPNAKYPCPEENCGKKFTNRTAIRKHLLSHRPREQWPFMCEFCGRRFQALSDVPKHYKTSAHRNDPRIPELGTPEWTALMKRAEVLPWRARATSATATSLVRPISPSSVIVEAPSPPPPILERNIALLSAVTLPTIPNVENPVVESEKTEQVVLTMSDAQVVASALPSDINKI